MARRSRSSFHPAWLLGGIIALAVIFAGGSYLLNQSGDPYHTVPPLEVTAYLENSNSLRGNTYRVKGEVLNVLGYSATEGRLISVGIDAKDDIIPMLIPASLGYVNIQKGQKFFFLVEVTDKGILRAKNLTKA
ncbi:MAG: hypothetical protein PHC88_13105 [Terrimicrobiaceae bacterium]|nr:hypothetical protein [Terrimicrobiaceae bacterium]